MSIVYNTAFLSKNKAVFFLHKNIKLSIKITYSDMKYPKLIHEFQLVSISDILELERFIYSL